MTVAIAHVVIIFFAWKQVRIDLIVVLSGRLLINSRLTLKLLYGEDVRVRVGLHQIVSPWVDCGLLFWTYVSNLGRFDVEV